MYQVQYGVCRVVRTQHSSIKAPAATSVRRAVWSHSKWKIASGCLCTLLYGTSEHWLKQVCVVSCRRASSPTDSLTTSKSDEVQPRILSRERKNRAVLLTVARNWSKTEIKQKKIRFESSTLFYFSGRTTRELLYMYLFYISYKPWF